MGQVDARRQRWQEHCASLDEQPSLPSSSFKDLLTLQVPIHDDASAAAPMQVLAGHVFPNLFPNLLQAQQSEQMLKDMKMQMTRQLLKCNRCRKLAQQPAFAVKRHRVSVICRHLKHGHVDGNQAKPNAVIVLEKLTGKHNQIAR